MAQPIKFSVTDARGIAASTLFRSGCKLSFTETYRSKRPALRKTVVAVSSARRPAPERQADRGGVSGENTNASDPRRQENAASIRSALKSRQRQPKKWLGQHYILNDEVCISTVAAAEIQPGDIVLEIGPGTGALTDALLHAGARVLAVEKDPDMVAVLQQRFKGNDHIEICHSDVLKWPVEAELRRRLADSWQPTNDGEGTGRARRIKLVSNLPFNITTDVLRRFLPMGHLISSVVLMLQEEAAQRLVEASPKRSEYRRINLLVHFFSVPQYHFFVPRRSFLPPPNVDAAVVSFTLQLPEKLPVVPSVNKLFLVVDLAFQGKRKMLRNSLSGLYGSEAVDAALAAASLPATARPEELTLDNFVALSRLLDAADDTSDANGPSVSALIRQ